jgi:hypothetical protein
MIFTSTMPGAYPDIVEKTFQEESFIFIDVFYPSGEPISQHRLRCSSFEVVHYIFMSHLLAATATSVREYSRLKYQNPKWDSRKLSEKR